MTFTRRHLGRLAVAAAPALAGVRAFAAPNSKFGGVQIGLQTYSFRTGVPKAEFIPDMVKLGLSEVELMSGDCEALAGIPPAPAGPGRGPGGGGGGRGRQQGDVAMAPNGCPVNTPSGQFSQRSSGAAPARGGAGGGGRGRGPASPEQEAYQKAVKDWRLAATPDTWKGVHKQFSSAGIALEILCYNMNMNMPDEEIDYAFHMAQGLGVKVISCSSTVSFAKRVAPYAEKYKLIWAGHGHADIYDPEQFAKPETFEMLIGMNKYMGINLDIGHYTAAGYDPIPFMEKHHDRITNIHLKDRNKPDKCGVSGNVEFGKGDTPIKEVLLLMKKNKYKFPANIELEYHIPDGSDPVVEVGKCLQFCRDILSS